MLEKPADLEHDYATAILQKARQNAGTRPTPQARMAAEVLSVRGGAIAPSAGGPAAEVGIGSEFGSVLFPQFHRPPNPRGYWLYPATRDQSVLKKTDESLEDVLKRAIS